MPTSPGMDQKPPTECLIFGRTMMGTMRRIKWDNLLGFRGRLGLGRRGARESLKSELISCSADRGAHRLS